LKPYEGEELGPHYLVVAHSVVVVVVVAAAVAVVVLRVSMKDG
jgi:hypothetical protein